MAFFFRTAGAAALSLEKRKKNSRSNCSLLEATDFNSKISRKILTSIQAGEMGSNVFLFNNYCILILKFCVVAATLREKFILWEILQTLDTRCETETFYYLDYGIK